MINVIFICSTNLFIDSHCKQCLFIISKSMSLVRESQLRLVHIPFTLTILRVDTLQLHLLLSLVTESFLRPIPFIAVALAHLRFCLITHITPPFAASVIAAHRILPLHSPSQKPTHRHIPSAPPPPPRSCCFCCCGHLLTGTSVFGWISLEACQRQGEFPETPEVGRWSRVVLRLPRALPPAVWGLHGFGLRIVKWPTGSIWPTGFEDDQAGSWQAAVVAKSGWLITLLSAAVPSRAVKPSVHLEFIIFTQ